MGVSEQPESSAANAAALERIDVPCPLCGANEARPERILNGFQLVRCRRCTMVYVSPQYSPESLRSFYANKSTVDYVKLYSKINTPFIIDGYRKTVEELEQLLPGRGRLLDVGCGAGYFFEQAQKRGWEAHGVDLGQWAAAAAAERGVCNLHVGDVSDLDLPEGYFDVVYSAQMLEHVSRPIDEVAAIRKLLRPGGLLYVDVPNYHTLPILLNRDDFMLNMPPQHINYFTPRTLRRLLVDGGFQNIQIRTSSGLKLENLFGRPLRNDITAAYGLDGNSSKSMADSATQLPAGPSAMQKGLSAVKGAMRSLVVDPLFYRAAQVGMLLIGTARRP